MFKNIADRFWNNVPGLRSLWFRAEADDIIDLRLDLEDDTWEAREAAIEAVLDLKRNFEEVFVNFSFVLPDEAYSSAHSGSETKRVHSFV